MMLELRTIIIGSWSNVFEYLIFGAEIDKLIYRKIS